MPQVFIRYKRGPNKGYIKSKIDLPANMPLGDMTKAISKIKEGINPKREYVDDTEVFPPDENKTRKEKGVYSDITWLGYNYENNEIIAFKAEEGPKFRVRFTRFLFGFIGCSIERRPEDKPHYTMISFGKGKTHDEAFSEARESFYQQKEQDPFAWWC